MTVENQQERPKICRTFDSIIDGIGRWFAWLNIFLIAAIIVQVILRYVFGRGVVILEELQFHFYGVMLILAISYTLVHDGHIRLDLFHTRFKRRNKEKVEIFGIIFLLIPMLIVVFFHSIGFLTDSLRINESSDAPMGLCCRWAFKAFFPAGIILWAAAAVSRLIRAFAFLKKTPKEIS